MSNLFVEISALQIEHKTNKDGEDIEQRWLMGEPDFFKTRYDDTGDLYREMQREYGRCMSKMYVDRTSGEALCIGWVFQKRMPYQDAPKETYLQETWVSIHDAPPTKTIEYHYHRLDKPEPPNEVMDEFVADTLANHEAMEV